MSGRKRLIGVVRPLESLPCFGCPIFSTGRDLCAQIADKSDRISDFVEVDIPFSAIFPVASRLARSVGDMAIYAFFPSSNDVKFGSKGSVKNFLSSRRQEFEAYPFLLTDIAAFLGDAALLDEAIRRGADVLLSAGIPSAEEWYDLDLLRAFVSMSAENNESNNKLSVAGVMQSIIVAIFRGMGPDVEIDPEVAAWAWYRYASWLVSTKAGTERAPLELWSSLGDMFLGRFQKIGRLSASYGRGSRVSIDELLISASVVEQESECPFCPAPA